MVLSGSAARHPRLARALRVAACVWLPPLAALALSPLHECDHCLRSFAVLWPLAPGVLAGLAAAPLGGGPDATLVLAAPATLLLAWAAAAAQGARRASVRRLVPVAVALVSGASGVVLGNLLRM